MTEFEICGRDLLSHDHTLIRVEAAQLGKIGYVTKVILVRFDAIGILHPPIVKGVDLREMLCTGAFEATVSTFAFVRHCKSAPGAVPLISYQWHLGAPEGVSSGSDGIPFLAVFALVGVLAREDCRSYVRTDLRRCNLVSTLGGRALCLAGRRKSLFQRIRLVCGLLFDFLTFGRRRLGRRHHRLRQILLEVARRSSSRAQGGPIGQRSRGGLLGGLDGLQFLQ